MKITIKVFAFFLLLIMISCDDSILTPNGNLPPDTKIYLDTILNQQNSRVNVSWSGDDPDGLVIGISQERMIQHLHCKLNHPIQILFFRLHP
jgi:hypothetical protein